MGPPKNLENFAAISGLILVFLLKNDLSTDMPILRLPDREERDRSYSVISSVSKSAGFFVFIRVHPPPNND
jgi:hypothetical protein